LIELGIGRFDDGELVAPGVFRIIFRFAVVQAHVTLDREEIGEEAAGEHDDEAGVGQMDAKFAPGPAKTFRVRRD
jgi:hypothetical protein